MKKYTFADYGFQFITVTAGVLIALFIDGLAERNSNRELVESARATILLEIADNKKDLEATLSGIAADREAMLNAVRFADEILSKGKTKITSLQLHYNVADKVSDSSWRTAERTGALAHMDYAEVQKYSRIYEFQDLFMQQQRQALSQLTLAGAILNSDFDPEHPKTKDLEIFRARVMDVSALVKLQEDFGKKLLEDYSAALKP
jgi:hypothetical protein